MSAIDHMAEAQKHYEEAVDANQNGKWETSRFEMQLAKFHTETYAAEQTAELVKQQRIANLQTERNRLQGLSLRGFLNAHGVTDITLINSAIDEGLNLS